MVYRGNYLFEARQVLADHALPMRKRIEVASALLWREYVLRGSEWPEGVQWAAVKVLDQVFAGGRPRTTAPDLSDKAAQRLARELQRVVDRCIGDGGAD